MKEWQYKDLLCNMANILGGPTVSYSPEVENKQLKERIQSVVSMITETLTQMRKDEEKGTKQ